MGVLSPSPEPCLARHFHSLSREDKCQSLEVSRLPSRILGGAAIVVVGGGGRATQAGSILDPQVKLERADPVETSGGRCDAASWADSERGRSRAPVFICH